jgi:hypothetical protein
MFSPPESKLIGKIVFYNNFLIPTCLLHKFIHRCQLMYHVDLYESFIQSFFEICFDLMNTLYSTYFGHRYA